MGVWGQVMGGSRSCLHTVDVSSRPVCPQKLPKAHVHTWGGHGKLSTQLITVGCWEGTCRALERKTSGHYPLDLGHPGSVVTVQGGCVELALSGVAPSEDPGRAAAWPGWVGWADQVHWPGPPRADSWSVIPCP